MFFLKKPFLGAGQTFQFLGVDLFKLYLFKKKKGKKGKKNEGIFCNVLGAILMFRLLEIGTFEL